MWLCSTAEIDKMLMSGLDCSLKNGASISEKSNINIYKNLNKFWPNRNTEIKCLARESCEYTSTSKLWRTYFDESTIAQPNFPLRAKSMTNPIVIDLDDFTFSILISYQWKCVWCARSFGQNMTFNWTPMIIGSL